MQRSADFKPWVFIYRPTEKKVIKTRWVFDEREEERPGKPKEKARLVAKGFAQIPGVDYVETWSPTLATRTIHFLFSVAIQTGQKVRHFDIKQALLNAPLAEKIVVEPAP